MQKNISMTDIDIFVVISRFFDQPTRHDPKFAFPVLNQIGISMYIVVFARHFVALVAIAFGLVSEEAKPLRVCAFSLFRARQPELKVDNQMVLLRLLSAVRNCI